jgi:hypothetical protein
MEENEKIMVWKSLYAAFENGCAYAKGGRGNTSLWTDYVGKGFQKFQHQLILKGKENENSGVE